MPREITTTGSKLVSTLMKEFNNNFPYLRLGIFPPTAKKTVAAGGTITNVDISKKLSEVRTKVGNGEISLTGSRKVGNVEREFDEIFGLYVQICYTSKDGSRYYTGSSDDSKTLAELNREKEALGCKKDEWK